MVWKRKMYLVYLDLGLDGITFHHARIFKFKAKAEMYRGVLQSRLPNEKFGKYEIMEIEAIW